MRRELACNIGLCERRGRTQDQLDAIDSLGNVSCHQRELHVVPAVRVFYHDARARSAMRRYLRYIAPPEPDLMALQRKIARPRERTVAATKYRDAHGSSLLIRGGGKLPQ